MLIEAIETLDLENAVVRMGGRYVLFDQHSKGGQAREWVWVDGRWVEREKGITVTKYNEDRLRKDRPYLFRGQSTE